MKTKTINVVTNLAKARSIKKLLTRISTQEFELEVSNSNLEVSGDELILKVSLSSEVCDTIVRKLHRLGIKIVGLPPKISEKIRNKKSVKEEHDSSIFEEKRVLPLEQMINCRYHKELDLIENPEGLEEKLKKSPNESKNHFMIQNIEELLNKALASKNNADRYIDQLIEISTNRKLKLRNALEIKLIAGEAAIIAASANKSELGYLIEIANNNKLHEYTCYKAFMKFSAITLAEMGEFRKELEMAVKEINLRWIKIINDTIEHKFSEHEHQLFNRLVVYIDQNRKN